MPRLLGPLLPSGLGKKPCKFFTRPRRRPLPSTSVPSGLSIASPRGLLAHGMVYAPLASLAGRAWIALNTTEALWPGAAAIGMLPLSAPMGRVSLLLVPRPLTHLGSARHLPVWLFFPFNVGCLSNRGRGMGKLVLQTPSRMSPRRPRSTRPRPWLCAAASLHRQ